MALQQIDAKMLSKMFLAGAKNLENKKEWINELNVFPVPDGDTGTNMTMTIMSAAREVSALGEDADMAALCKAISSGSLRGARGNSGVILSQLFRGFTKSIKEEQVLDIPVLTRAFDKAVETAYKAVMKPKEGTILTVARGASDKAKELCEDGAEDLEQFLGSVIEHARYVLSQTPEMLPVLKQAGVVDSGGQGLVEVLSGAYDAFLGKEIDLTVAPAATAKAEDTKSSLEVQAEAEIKFGYCTEFIILLNKPFNVKAEMDFKAFLESIGDSIVCVADDDVVKVHVHTNDPGLAIQKALKYGALSNMKIDNMRLEHQEKLFKLSEKEAAQKKAEEEKAAQPPKEVGFLAVSVGDGLSELFKSLGVDYIIEGGQTMNPSTEDILAAIMSCPAETVFVLPNNKNIIMAAEQAVKLADRKVCVLQTRTIPQGMSAMLAFDPDADFNTNRIEMTNALERVATGQVTFAARDSDYEGHAIKQGEILCIENGKLSFVEKDVSKAAYKLTKKLVKGDSSFITILYGSDVTDEAAEALQKQVAAKFSNLDVNLINGGQPVYYYIISVE